MIRVLFAVVLMLLVASCCGDEECVSGFMMKHEKPSLLNLRGPITQAEIRRAARGDCLRPPYAACSHRPAPHHSRRRFARRGERSFVE